MLDKIPAVVGVVGRPRHRPDALLSDRGYDHTWGRRAHQVRHVAHLVRSTT
ncbi:hypothetical protein HUF15_23745 [Streptomyces samsunensis]|uniref:hypothetical protein n=1 Tax=Streptomyces malaysiensis TaxID=92644 RepID=UPI001581A6DF|nr:hypothetical protein [Streptomyces samsunensis]